jgi:hypothetical protein
LEGWCLALEVVDSAAETFVGSWLFGVLKIQAPFSGLTSTICVAFVGAVLLLLLFGAVGRGRRRRAWPSGRSVDHASDMMNLA